MFPPRAVRALFIGLAVSVASAGATHAGPLSACILSGLSSSERAKVLAAYADNMSVGAAALDKHARKLQAQAALCAKRRDVRKDWVQTMAGAEAVQIHAASLLAAKRLERPQLDAAWAAAPNTVFVCIR